MSWLEISAIISALVAFGLLFLLGMCWAASAEDRRTESLIREMEAEAERVIRHGEHPWNLR